ncbi:MAG: response regulator transcription factor [Erysipelotrichales bacterium]|nr:response regulator transcription factor [Erysipelotrichales bacterium]
MSLIYIVEDDQNISEIETYALKSGGFEVAPFSSAKDFYTAVNSKKPTLVILDIMLPDDDGLTILKQLKSNPDTMSIPVIMVSAKDSEMDKVRGLDNGADDYLTKPFGVMELIARVKALIRRMAPVDTEKFLRYESIVIDDEKHRVYVEDINIELTFKEYELLKILVLNAGIVLTRDVLMNKVWGTDYQGESRTVDMHIKTLRQKLKDAGQLIKTVRNVGYMVE